MKVSYLALAAVVLFVSLFLAMQSSRHLFTGLAVLPAANCPEPIDAFLSTNKSSYAPLEGVFIRAAVQSNVTFNESSLFFEVIQPDGQPFFLNAIPSGNSTFYVDYVQAQGILLGNYSARVLLGDCYLNATPLLFSISPPPIFMSIAGSTEYLPGGISLFAQVNYQNGSSAGSPDFGLVVLDDSGRSHILFPTITPLETGYDVSFSMRTPGSYTAVLTALKDGASAAASLAFNVSTEMPELTLALNPDSFEVNKSGVIRLNSSGPAHVQLEITSPSGRKTLVDGSSEAGFSFTPEEAGTFNLTVAAKSGRKSAVASARINVSERKIKLSGSLKDSLGKPLQGRLKIRGADVEFASGESFDFNIPPGRYDVSADFDNFSVKRLWFQDFEFSRDSDRIADIREVSGLLIEGKSASVAFALNPTANCSYANVTFSYGAVPNPSLFKCRDWDYNASVCTGAWERAAALPQGPSSFSYYFDCADPGFGVVETSPILNGNFSTSAQYWTNQTTTSDCTSGWDNTGRTGGSAWSRIYGNNKACSIFWNQSFSYAGTIPPDAANLTFCWNVTIANVADPSYLKAVLTNPTGGSSVLWTSPPITAMSAWSCPNVSIGLNNFSSTGVYNLTLQADLDTGADVAAELKLYQDDVNLTLWYSRNISLSIRQSPAILDPGGVVNVSGQATLLPDGVPVAGNLVGVFLDGQPAWWNGSWPYRVPIVVNSSSALSYYQVLLNLNWTAGMNETFQDLRFTYYNSTSGTETQIPYWVENYTAGANASVWVKTNLAAGNNTVYAYYGNASATSASNGSAVFVFFDDFESGTLTKWATPGTGSIVSSPVHGGTKAALVTSNSATISGTFGTLGNKYALDFWMYDGGQAARSEVWMGFANPTTQRFVLASRYDNTYITYFSPSSYVNTPFTRNTNAYSKATIIYAGGSSIKYTINNGALQSATAAWSDGVNQVWLGGGWGGQSEYVDDVRVRNYSSPEPSVLSIGSQQSALTNSSGGYSFEFTAPQAAGTHVVKVNLTDPNGVYGENSTNFSVRIPFSGPAARGLATGTNHANRMEAVNLSVYVPPANIGSVLLDGAWVFVTKPDFTVVRIGMTGNSSGGTWSGLFTGTSALGNYSASFYANLTDGFNLTQGANATFYVQNLSVSESLIPVVANPGEAVNVFGQAALLPDGAPLAGNLVSVFLDGQLASPAWWSGSWPYRKAITINGSNVSLTDYQVQLNINWTAGMNSTFQDLRFTYYNSTSGTETQIPYWVENYTAGANASVWVKTNLAAGNNTVYAYYGNASATSASNGSATFLFFEDFDGGLYRESGWTNTDATKFSLENNELKITDFYNNRDNQMYNNNSRVSAIGQNFEMRFDAVASLGLWNPQLLIGLRDSAPTANSGNAIYTDIWGGGASGSVYAYYVNASQELAYGTYSTAAKSGGVNDNRFYYTFRAYNGNATLDMYSDYLRTTKVGSTNLTYATFTPSVLDFPDYVHYDPANNNYFATTYMDNLIVRNYSSSEPSVLSIGIQQTSALTNSSGGYSYNFSAPQTAGVHVVKVNLTDPNGVYGENSTDLSVRVNLTNPQAAFLGDGRLNITVVIPQSNINYPAVNLSKVWANVSWVGGSELVFLSGNVSGGTWNYTYTSLRLGAHNATFYANLTDGFSYSTAPNAAFDDSCGVLGVAGASYLLVQNASSSGTCFTIGADNVTLDGQGLTVNYSQSVTGFAVNNSGGYDNVAIKNLNIVQGNASVSGSHAIYAYGMLNGSVTNNTISLSGPDSYGLYLNSSALNSITGGSIVSAQSHAFYLRDAGITNNFSSTNFTGQRSVYFYDAASWFNYRNGSSNNLWLKTSVSAQGYVNRTLAVWSQPEMTWNDTASAALTASYNLTGLLPSMDYVVTNESSGGSTAQPLSTDSSGNMGFSIGLAAGVQTRVSMINNTAPPTIQIQSPANATYAYSSVDLNFTVFDFFGVSSCRYEISNSSGSFNVSLPGCLNATLAGVSEGSNGVRVWANDSANNWNVSSAVFFYVDSLKPSVYFVSPTDANNSFVNRNWSFVNISVSDASATTAFIDWNNSLVGWWRFNNESGENTTFFRDWSSHGNNGSCSGATCPNYTVAGRFGSALWFDGVNDSVYIPPSPLFDFLKTDSFTIEFFVNGDRSSGTTEVFFARKAATGTFPDIYISRASPNAGIQFAMGDSDGHYNTTRGFNISNNTWHHVAAQYDGAAGVMSLYIDGLLANQTATAFTGNFTYPSNVSACVGIYSCFSDWLPYPFMGVIDEVRVWRRTLSPQEINASYNAGLWRLYRNFTNLADGTYPYAAYAQDSTGKVNQTGARILGVDSIPPTAAFVGPTPQDGSYVSANHAQINLTVVEPHLDALVLGWNGTNYSFYDPSLVLAFNFNNNSGIGEGYNNSNGTRVVDISRYGNDGTLHVGAVGSGNYTLGRFGGAFEFDGVEDYVESQDSASLDSITRELTVMAWVKIRSNGTLQSFVEKWLYGSGVYERSFVFYSNVNGRLDLEISADGTNSNETWLKSANNISNDVWTHVAATSDGTTMRLYINAEQDPNNASAPGGGAIHASSANLHVGVWEYNSGVYAGRLNGSIDEVRVYNRALSPAEIRVHYLSEFQRYNLTEWRLYDNLTGLSDGTYAYFGMANDTAGNVNSTGTRTLTVDTVKPSVSFVPPTDPDSSYVNRNWSLVNVSVSDASYVTSFIDWNYSLAGWWRFNGESGESSSFFRDWGSYGNNASCVACPVLNSSGKFGSALQFDGVDDVVSVPDSDSLDLSSSFTVEGWFKPSRQFDRFSDYYQGLLDKGSYQLFLDKSDGKLKFFMDSAAPKNWSSFGSGMNNSVSSLVVWNGSLYAGGSFTSAGGVSANYIARWDGGAWSALGSGVNGGVVSLVVWNGSLYAGGGFTSAGGVSANRTARWNGSGWSALGSGMNNTVRSLVVWNGSLYAGGGFTSAGGVSANYTARWNGSGWSALGSGMNGEVFSFAVWNGSLYAGGFFTSAGGVSANYIARWDGGGWSALGSGMTGWVEPLAVWNGSLIAGGQFTSAGGVTVHNIARWNGSGWSALGSGLNSDVWSLAVWTGGLVAGGSFNYDWNWEVPLNYVARWNGSAWSALGSGMDDEVDSLAVWNGSLYAGGIFTSAGGVSANYIARWSSGEDRVAGSSTSSWPADWHYFAVSYDNSTLSLFNDGVLEGSVGANVSVSSNSLPLLLGSSYGSREGGSSSSGAEQFGGFLDEVRIHRRALSFQEVNASFNSKTSVLYRNFTGLADGGYSYVAYAQDAAGNVNGTGSRALSVDVTPPSISFVSPTDANNSFVNRNWSFVNVSASDFTNTTAFIEWNSSLVGWWRFNQESGETSSFFRDWSSYGNNGSCSACPVLNSSGRFGSALQFDGVNDMVSVADSDSLDLSGAFTVEGWFRPGNNFSGSSDYYQGLLDKGSYQLFLDKSDGKLKFFMDSAAPKNWSALGSGIDDSVYSLVVWNGSLYAGGTFTSASGVSANRTARWNGSGWSALGSGMNGNVYPLVVWNGSLYAGGTFTSASGVSANRTARWNGSGWSALGSGMDAIVVSLAVWNGSLYAGGTFTSAGGVSANRIARWDGGGWSALGSGMDNTVYSLVVWNGSLYAGGPFTSAGGVSANYVARWNGSGWSALGSGVSGGSVDSFAVWNGSLYAGGEFTSAGGVSANYVARWNGSGWSALGSGMNNYVVSLVVWNGSLYAGGFFTSAGGVSANRTARWDGGAWSALGSGMNSTVRSLAVWNGSLVAGGEFTSAGDVSANRVARWSSGDERVVGSGATSWGSDWHYFAVSYDNSTLSLFNDGVLEGGVGANVSVSSNSLPLLFGSSYGSREGGWSSSGAEQFDGLLDEVRIWNRALSPVEVNASFNSKTSVLYRNFSGLLEGNYSYAAYAQDSLGNVNGTGVRALVVDTVLPAVSISSPSGGAYLNSAVVAVSGVSSDVHLNYTNVSLYDSSWVLLNSSVNFSSSWAVVLGGASPTGIFYVNATAFDYAFNSNVSGVSVTVDTAPPAVYFVGPTDANGSFVSRSWSFVNVSVSDFTNTTAFIDWNSSLVGWWRFNQESGEASSFFRDWSSYGNNGSCSACPVLNSSGKFGSALQFDGVDDVVSVPDSDSLDLSSSFTVEGWFKPRNNFSGSSDYYQGLLDKGSYQLFLDKSDGKLKFFMDSAAPKSWSSFGSGMNNTVSSLVVWNGSLYAGGTFTSAGGVSANRTARWNGSGWSALGSGMNDVVYALAVWNGSLYAGGDFTSAGGVSANRTARWNGSGWSALGSGMDFQVFSLVVWNGSLYAGGDFTSAGGVSANSTARWNGSGWSALGSGMGGVDDYVASLVVWNGSLVAGGTFESAGGVSAKFIARWNGGAWSALGSNSPSGSVDSLVVWNSSLVVSGMFSCGYLCVGPNVALWNGSTWGTLGSGVNGSVVSLAVWDGGLYAGGDFTSADGVSANSTARWNGSGWSALGSGMNNYVASLAVWNGSLYAGGWFTSAGGVSANYVARWSSGDERVVGSGATSWGSDWHYFAVSYDSSSLSLFNDGVLEASVGANVSVSSNSLPLLLGTSYGSREGGYSSSGSEQFAGLLDEVRVHRRAFSPVEVNASFNSKTSGLYRNFSGLADGSYSYVAYAQDLAGNVNNTGVRTLTVDTAPAISFVYPTDANNSFVNRNWSFVNVSVSDYSNVTAFIDWNSSLVGWWRFNNGSGEASSFFRDWSSYGNNGSCSACPVLNSSGRFGSALQFDGVDDVVSVADSDSLDLSGAFTVEGWFKPRNNFSGSSDYYQGLLDKGSYQLFLDKSDGKLKFFMDSNAPKSWSSFGSGMNDSVRSLAVWNGSLYAGGAFTTAGGVSANYIARWNGSGWSALGSGMNDVVYALAVWNGSLYAGGLFTSAGGVSANRTARWNGSAWGALGSGLNGEVRSLAVWNGSLYAGGEFNSAGGVSANSTARWNGSGWSALGSGVNIRVIALAVWNGSLYAGGEFTSAGGVSANYIARWDGSAWSALGSGMDFQVFSLAVWNGSLYAGGWFTSAGGVSANYIARWDGSTWSALGSGTSFSVFSLAVWDGSLYAGGWFTSAGGVSANYTARWNGSGWSALGSGTNNLVYSLAVWNGSLYAGGAFTTAGGVSANRTARWSSGDERVVGSGATSWGSDWHYFAVSYDSSSLSLFNDGVLEGGVGANVSVSSSSLPLLLGSSYGSREGGYSSSGSEQFDGLLDEVRIWNRALSPVEVNASFNSKTSGLYRNFTGLAEGAYSYAAYAEDSLGNVNGTGVRALVVDTVLPAVSISSPSSGAYLNSAVVAVSGVSSDVHLNYTNVSLYDSSWVLLNSSVNFSSSWAVVLGGASPTGIFYINATAFDYASNYNVSGVSVTVDTAPPAVYFVGPTDANESFVARSWSFVNVSVSDFTNNTAFIDWNNSLVGWWRFNQESGETSSFFRDWSFYGNNGSCSACPVLNSSGKFGSALQFDGVDDVVSVPDSDSLDLSSSFTVEGWFKPSRQFDRYSDYYQGLLDKGSYQLFLDKSDGRLKFFMDSAAPKSWSALGSGMGGGVYSSAIWNNSLIAGGVFTSPAYIARWDGSSWSALGSGVNDYVISLAVWNGSLYAGGEFTSAGGVSANYTARWNGSGWSALGSGMTARVRSLAVWNGSLYAGGVFTSAGGVSANYTARWNGSSWSALGSGTNNTVSSLIVWNGSLVAGGWFTSAGGVSANHIARWDGSSWSALGSGVDGNVEVFAVWNGTLVAGGYFTSAGGVSANRTARWNGSGWSALGSGVDGSVFSLAVWDGGLYAGGVFTSAGGVSANYTARWNGSGWSALGSGMNDSVNSLAVWNGSLVAGGDFTSAGGVSANYVARWSSGDERVVGSGATSWGSDWHYFAVSYDNSTLSLFNDGVLEGSVGANVSVSSNSLPLLLGTSYGSRQGDFASSGPEQFAGLLDEVRVHRRAFSAGEVNASFNSGVYRLYRNFSGLADGSYSYVAYAQDLAGNVNNTGVRTLTVDTAPAISFVYPTDANNSFVNRNWSFVNVSVSDYSNVTAFIDWNSSLVGWWRFNNGSGETSSFFRDWSSYGNNGSCSACPVLNSSGRFGSALQFDGVDDVVSVPDSDSLDLSGAFTVEGWFKPRNNFSGSSDYYQGLLDKGSYQLFLDKSDGKLKFFMDSNAPKSWSSFGSGMNNYVDSLVVWNGSLYAGGTFTSAGGVSANRTARWNGSGWSALGSGMNNAVLSLVVWNGSLYAGGTFTSAGGVSANRTARWNGSGWSALGSGINNDVYSLVVWNGSLYAGGWFNSAGGVSANSTARWNGSGWSALGSGVNIRVIALAVWNGSLYAGGEFTSAGGVSANYIARWDGGAWSALGSGMDFQVFSLAVWNGSLYAGGWFTSAGGVSANYIARWDGGAWSALGSGIDGFVFSLAVWNGSLVAGGDFTSAGGVSANRTARWNGSGWSSLGSGMDGGVYSLAVWNGSLVAGGDFTSAGGVSANRTARWSSGDERVVGSGTDVWGSDWHYFAVSYDSSSLSLFNDGVLEGSVGANVSVSSSALPLLLGSSYGSREGGYSSSGSEQFDGLLDEVRIHRRAFSPVEVNASFNSKTSGLYRNFTGLAEGAYSYAAYAQDSLGNVNGTENRILKVDYIMPYVFFVPPTPSNSSVVYSTFVTLNATITENDLDAFMLNWNGTNYSFYDPTLVLALNFNNNAAIGDNSALAKDISRYGNDGLISGAVYAPGKYGASLGFDGVDDYVSVSDSSSLNVSGNVTFSAWIRRDSDAPGDTTLLIKQLSGGSNDVNYAFALNGSGYLRYVSVNNSGSWFNASYSATPVSAGSWHHVTFVRTPSFVNFYIDGSLDNSVSCSSSLCDNVKLVGAPVRIGANASGGSVFNGTMDELRLYGRALSSGEVAMHYQSEFQKLNSSEFHFLDTITGLSGTYAYYAYVNDSLGASNNTGIRTVTIVPPCANATLSYQLTNLQAGNYRVSLNITSGNSTANCFAYVALFLPNDNAASPSSGNGFGINGTYYSDKQPINFSNTTVSGEYAGFVYSWHFNFTSPGAVNVTLNVTGYNDYRTSEIFAGIDPYWQEGSPDAGIAQHKGSKSELGLFRICARLENLLEEIAYALKELAEYVLGG